MNTPRPVGTPSRLNAGAYRVRVEHKSLIAVCESDRWPDVLAKIPQIKGVLVDFEIAATADGLGAEFKTFSGGTLAPDGTLSVEPEAWRARQYRRAVMSGAGVYRWGLWAFLGARQGLAFTRPAGEHFEPHGVKVEWRDKRVPFWWDWDCERAGAYHLMGIRSEELVGLPVQQKGALNETGALEIEPYSWAVKARRFAVMNGAGVYQAGLWANLACRRTAQPVKPEQRAALGVNDLNTFERFNLAAHKRIRHSVRWRTSKRIRQLWASDLLEEVSYFARLIARREAGISGLIGRAKGMFTPKEDEGIRYKYAIYLQQGWARVARFCIHLGIQYDTGEEITERDLLEAGTFYHRKDGKLTLSHAYAKTLAEAACQVVSWINEQRGLVNAMYAALAAQAAAYRAHLARLVKPQRAPRRAPRPLYSRAIPPAAPLAPPAL